MSWLREKIIEVVIKNIQVGGWCGLCGIWTDCILLPVAWPYTVCSTCANEQAEVSN